MPPNAKVSTIFDQYNGLKLLEKLGTMQTFPRVIDRNCHKLSLLVFSDAKRKCESGQLSFPAGIPDDFANYSIYHVLSLYSHKRKRPVRSTGGTEIIAAGEAVGKDKQIAHV